MAAVAFLGESFSAVNALGLAVLVAGVFLFNWTKYRKIARGQARGGKPARDAGAAHREDGEPAADEEAVRLMPRAGAGAPRRVAAPVLPRPARVLRAPPGPTASCTPAQPLITKGWGAGRPALDQRAPAAHRGVAPGPCGA